MNTYLDNYERVLQQKGEPLGDQVYFYCPFAGCAGHDKKKFNINPELGGWNCFRCNQTVEGREDRPGGSAKDFAALMGDDYALWPKGVIPGVVEKIEPLGERRKKQIFGALFQKSTLSEADQQLLQIRGIDGLQAGYVSATPEMFELLLQQFGDEDMIRGGLAYRAENGDGQLHCRQCVQPGRILIPYWGKDQVDYFVGYARCPAQRPEQTDEHYQELKNRWAKTAGPAGYPSKIYGLAPLDADYVIVTEGQLKAVAARQRGFPCIGISGIGNSHKPAATQCVRQRVRRAIILFDTQLDGQVLVDHEAMRLAKDLLKVGIPTYKAELPLDPRVDNGEKMDIDSFLAISTAVQFAAILVEAGRRPYEMEEEVVAAAQEETDDAG